MTGTPSGTDARSPLGLAQRPLYALHAIENWLGMFFATLLTLSVAWFIYDVGRLQWDSLSPAQHCWWIVCGLAWVVLDVPYLIRLWVVAFTYRRPIAYETARTQWVPPLLLRPLVGAWWLAHFAMGAWFSIYAHSLTGGGSPMAALVLNFFMATAYGYAANGYLMLGVCALFRSDSIRHGAWQSRVVIDLALGLVGSGVIHF